MKQKLLILLLFSFTISLANPRENVVDGPQIGLLLYQFDSSNSFVFFSINIKNTGTETLTHIYLDNVPNSIDPVVIEPNVAGVTEIASLEPGEEDTITFWAYKSVTCFDQCQIIVYATTPANTQISDLSSPNNYFDDNFTYIQNQMFLDASQNGIYEDLNNNGIVDVGDVVNYTYTINWSSSNIVNTYFMDANAVIGNPDFSNATGIHYITQAEVDLGYVYNHSYIVGQDFCGNTITMTLNDETYCSCPNPNGANVITAITPLLPNQISGTVKFNFNNDNCSTGLAALSRRVSATDGLVNTYVSYTNNNGQYHILIPNSGNFTVTPTINFNQDFTSNPASTTVTSSSQNQNYANNDFCLSSSTGYGDLAVCMFNTSNAVPGFNAGYYINFYNMGATTLSGSVQLTFDGTKLSFIGASTMPSSTSSTTLTWNYTNLQPFQGMGITLGFAVATPPTANISNPLTFTLHGDPVAGDYNPSNNTFTWTHLIRSSFDPNDKNVIEGDMIDIGQTDDYLHYVTRFQNSGTANATTVVIKETLDPELDWDTFEPIASSHESTIQIRNGNELTYTFSNIDLPYESVNEPASHGWMTYKIKPKNNITIGEVMSSKSDIYFDYNSPIITNTVNTYVSALANADFVKSNFAIYPNPASNYITIEAKTDIESEYEIIDINGKLLLKGQTQSLQPISISALQSGFYFLTLKTDQGKANYKIIKN